MKREENKQLVSGVYAAPSKADRGGWGVFARHDAPANAVIEQCVVVPVPYDRDVLNEYRIAWNDETDCIATGCAELYNHSDDPSVHFVRDSEGMMLSVVTLRPVRAGEELFIRYACGPWW